MEEKMDRIAPIVREEWALLYTASAIVRKATERALARWNITLPQAIVLLRVIEAEEPVPLTKLARFLLQESPSVTTLVDRMCERGLVERTSDPNDRRKALIVPTEKGRQMRGTIWAAWREIQDDLWGGFSDDERQTFRELLRKFRNKNIKQIR